MIAKVLNMNEIKFNFLCKIKKKKILKLIYLNIRNKNKKFFSFI